jgi:hypothetical protein
MRPGNVEEGEPEAMPPSLPPLWPYLIACAFVANWVAFGTLHRDQHADSLLNVLVSLQRWTPFVWEQDRFGMLVPLLTMPIANPLGNMVAQATLSTFAGLLAFFLLARYAIRTAAYPLVGTLGAASLLALTPPYYRFEYLVDTSYGIGLSLAIWALILLEPGPGDSFRPRLIGSLVLMVLAHWVNSATALFLGPFLLVKGVPGLRWTPSRWPVAILRHDAIPPLDRFEILARGLWRTETTRALVLLAAGYAAGQAMIKLNPYQPTDLTALPMAEWPLAWRELLRTNRDALGPPFWPSLMGLEAVVGIVGLARRGRGGWTLVRSVAALLATAVALWLLMGTRGWVRMNDYAFRYLFPSALLAQTAVAGLAVAAFGVTTPSRPKTRGALAAGAGLILLAAGTWSYGFPSIAGVRRDIDRKFGALTDDLLDARCTCLAGNYWIVWPAVFHANLVRRERGDPQPLWGLTFRCGPTFDLWKDTPKDGWRAAILRGEGQETYLRSYLVGKLYEVEGRRTIRIMKQIVP